MRRPWVIGTAAAAALFLLAAAGVYLALRAPGGGARRPAACPAGGCLYTGRQHAEVRTAGPFEVRDARSGRRVPYFVRYPAGAAGPLPVVLWSHGGGGRAEPAADAGAAWATALARAGYAAVTVTVLRPADLPRACRGVGLPADCDRQAYHLRARPADARALLGAVADGTVGRAAGVDLDPAAIAAGGHSFGSYTAMVLGGARTGADPAAPGSSFADPRVRAVVAMSPQGVGRFGFTARSWDRMGAPALIGTGRGDTSPGERAADRLDPVRHAPPDAGLRLVYLDAPGTPHATFNLRADGHPGYAQWLSSTAVAFLDAVLRRDARARAWLDTTGPRSLPAVSGGVASLGTRPPVAATPDVGRPGGRGDRGDRPKRPRGSGAPRTGARAGR